MATEINCFGTLFATSSAPRDKILIIKCYTKLSFSPQTLVCNCQDLCAVYFTLNRQVGRYFLPGCCWLKRNSFSSKSPATDDIDKTLRLPEHSEYERRSAPVSAWVNLIIILELREHLSESVHFNFS